MVLGFEHCKKILWSSDVKIYAVKMENNTFDETAMLKLLDRQRREKINIIRPNQDRLRSIYAGLLLRYVFLETGHTKEEWDNVEITKGEFGKPYINNDKHFNYSLSHSGNWIVCAVGNSEVGVDIQEIKECKLQVAKRFFALEEYERLLNTTGTQQRQMFYKMWTCKESYAKLTGRGIGGGISEYIADENYQCIGQERALIHIYEQIDGYIVCACTRNEQFPKQLEILAGVELISI